jgi:tryptophanyl-tRNA synthetase
VSKKVVFSGLQPTGNLTLGNYLGAITNWVKMQDEYSCLFCLVDLHAITVPVDPKLLQENIITNLAAYLACGLDVEKSIIFNQSKVKEHSELGWILGCNTPIGWLNRMTQFKDKAGSDQEKASLGLYAYPVLMAADIMLYHATHIPVGEDQTQHIELARDVAGAFNRRYGVQYFTEPKAIVNKVATRIMSLQDGTKKMSKSDPSDLSRININDAPELIEKKIKKAKTDAIVGIHFDKTNRPEVSNLISIYAALTDASIESVCDRFKNSNNAEFKRDLTEVLVAKLEPIQKKMHELLEDKAYLLDLLNKQGEKAAHIAAKTMKEVKEIVGFC